MNGGLEKKATSVLMDVGVEAEQRVRNTPRHFEGRRKKHARSVRLGKEEASEDKQTSLDHVIFRTELCGSHAHDASFESWVLTGKSLVDAYLGLYFVNRTGQYRISGFFTQNQRTQLQGGKNHCWNPKHLILTKFVNLNGILS